MMIKIRDYYWQVWGSDILVEEECFDAAGDLLVDENGVMDCNKAIIEVELDDCLDVNGDSLWPECDPGLVHEEIMIEFSTPLIDSKQYTITVEKAINAPSCENVMIIGGLPNQV